MKPGFRLNEHNRNTNPCFESHDPSMMWDPVSEIYYSYSTDAAITSVYKQGIPIRKSVDLVEFTFVGHALSDEAVAEGSDNGKDFRRTPGFWAPYVEYSNGEYRMYYSATKAFGSSESRIWLAVSKSPEGPFENRGVVMDTWNTPDTDPNAIDAHVCDTADGRKYFIYGSFFGGIFLKELNPVTGMPVNPDAHYQGKCIARKPKDTYIDGPEGPAIIYNPETGYYYLFVSYGWLGDDYDIRVGRSKDIEGPYLDHEGYPMVDGKHGTKVAGSYQFSASNPFAGTDEADWKFDGFRGPGHGVPFYAPKLDTYFFVHHVRDGAQVFRNYSEEERRQSFRMHYMMIRPMFFIEGWPVLSPEPYAGESLHPVLLSDLIADTKTFMDEDVEYVILKTSDNTMQRSVVGRVSQVLNPNTTYVFDALDFENGSSCWAVAGYTVDGQAIWGKIKK